MLIGLMDERYDKIAMTRIQGNNPVSGIALPLYVRLFRKYL